MVLRPEEEGSLSQSPTQRGQKAMGSVNQWPKPSQAGVWRVTVGLCVGAWGEALVPAAIVERWGRSTAQSGPGSCWQCLHGDVSEGRAKGPGRSEGVKEGEEWCCDP